MEPSKLYLNEHANTFPDLINGFHVEDGHDALVVVHHPAQTIVVVFTLDMNRFAFGVNVHM